MTIECYEMFLKLRCIKNGHYVTAMLLFTTVFVKISRKEIEIYRMSEDTRKCCATCIVSKKFAVL